MEPQQSGFIKKVIVLYVKTSVGDRWKKREDCDFVEIKCSQEGYVVEEKEVYK